MTLTRSNWEFKQWFSLWLLCSNEVPTPAMRIPWELLRTFSLPWSLDCGLNQDENPYLSHIHCLKSETHTEITRGPWGSVAPYWIKMPFLWMSTKWNMPFFSFRCTYGQHIKRIRKYIFLFPKFEKDQIIFVRVIVATPQKLGKLKKFKGR